MRWILTAVFVAVLVGLLSVTPAAAQTATPAPQAGDDFWLDGPYEMGSTGSSFHLFDEIFIPPMLNNPIVGVAFKNFQKSGGTFILAKLGGHCDTEPCLQTPGSPRQLIANGVYCKTGIAVNSIYRPNCATLFPGYNSSFNGVSSTGPLPRWDGGYLSLKHEEEGNVTRTWSIDVYIIRFGKPPLKALFDATPTLGIAPLTVEFENLSTPEHYITSYAWDFGDGECAPGTCTSGAKDPPPYTYSQCGNYVVRLTVTGENDDTDYYEVPILVKCESVEYPRPLKLADEQPQQRLFDDSRFLNDVLDQGTSLVFAPVLNTSSVYSVHAISNAPDAYVHSISTGTVKSIKRLTWDQCSFGGNVSASDQPGNTIIAEYDGVTVANEPNSPEDLTCITELVSHQEDGSLNPFRYFYYLDVRDVYVVTIRLNQYLELVYIVKDAPLYLTVGDSVQPECVLGKTIAMVSIPTFDAGFLDALVNFIVGESVGSLVSAGLGGGWGLAWGLLKEFLPDLNISFSEVQRETTHGVALLSLFQRYDRDSDTGSEFTEFEEVELLTLIGAQYPTNDNFCNGNPAYSDCVTKNPRMMNNGENWQVSGGVVEWNNPGVVLSPGESVYQTLILNPSTSYALTIQARPIGNRFESQMRLFLGTTSNNGVTLVVPEWNNYKIASGILEPDTGAFYTAGVQNTGTVPIEIRFICVTDGNPNLAPSSCYFNNPSFDYGTSGWIAGEDVLAFDGAVILQFGDSISQNLRLLPNGDVPHTYTVYVIYQGYFTGEPDPTGIDYVMQWRWPGDASFEDFGPESPDPRTIINATFNFEVTSQTEGLMTIAPNITASNSTLVGIRIFEICMGGPFPGQEPGGGEEPPFESKCTINTQPQGNEFGAWIRWHWGNLDQFYNCELMPFLNRLYKRIDQGITLMSWQARYWQAVAVRYGNWLVTDLFPWLNGHFTNMAGGRVTNVNQQCNNLFCLLTSLIEYILAPIVNLITSILGQAAALLFSIITALFSIFLALIGNLFASFAWLSDLLSILVNAWNNSTPTPIPGLPTCAVDPKSSGFCIVLWMMENTVFAGAIGSLFIPIIIGISSAHLILYIIGELKKTVLESSQSS